MNNQSTTPFFNISAVFFLVLGTAVGAGMATLPLLCQNLSVASIGFILTMSFLIMHASASYLIELSTENSSSDNILTYVSRYQKQLYWPTKVSYLIFFWSLMAFYLSTLEQFCLQISPILSTWAHPCVVSILLFSYLHASTFLQAFLNKILVIFMLITLCVMMILGCQHLHTLKLPIVQPLSFDWHLLTPLMMFFGYHLTIPSFMRYLPNKTTLSWTCFMAGICILLIYFLWSVIMLDLIAQYPMTDLQGDFITQIAHRIHEHNLAQLGIVFSLLAVTTSCMGMSLGTQDFLMDGLRAQTCSRGIVSAITIAPSLLLIYLSGGNYLKVLHFASFFALYLLVILPAWLVIKKRTSHQQGPVLVLMLCGLLIFGAIFNL